MADTGIEQVGEASCKQSSQRVSLKGICFDRRERIEGGHTRGTFDPFSAVAAGSIPRNELSQQFFDERHR